MIFAKIWKVHILRIFRESESVHNYDIKINNHSFDYVMKKKDSPINTSSNSGKYERQSSDPFAKFEKVSINSYANNNDVANSSLFLLLSETKRW